jgi:hypothetical protein
VSQGFALPGILGATQLGFVSAKLASESFGMLEFSIYCPAGLVTGQKIWLER